MSTWRVVDAGLEPTTTLVEIDHAGPRVLWQGPPEAAPDQPVEAELHRWLTAPEGCPELLPAHGVDARQLRHAGRFEPRDTAARLAAIVMSAGQDDVARGLVFDTPFFDALPPTARHYAVPPEVAATYGLYRRGRHGPVHRLAAQPGRCVSVVRAGEVSVAALRDGQPLEVSCGVSGLEGVPGAGSVGDIDPAAVLYLVEALDLTIDEAEAALTANGGLRGVADAADPGFAQRFLVHRLRRQIGAMAAVLDGLDALTFSGCDAALVADVVAGLGYLGVGQGVAAQQTPFTPATAAAVVAHTRL